MVSLLQSCEGSQLIQLIWFLDQTGTALEHLKSDFVCDWLPKVIKSHYNSFVNSLLPHPPEYARVGGQWWVQTNLTSKVKLPLIRPMI